MAVVGLLVVFLLLAALLAVSSAAGRRIDKCCPNGDILVLNGTAGSLACVEQALPRRHWLLDPSNEAKPTGLPNCGHSSGHLVQKLLEELDSRIPSHSCLDVFFDSPTNQDFPVIVQCSDETIKDKPSIFPDSHAPKIRNLRKCCAGTGAVYDVDKKHCVQGPADLKPAFKDRSRSDRAQQDFIDVYNGPPTCEHALVDYKLEATDVYNDAGSISISIPWNPRSSRKLNLTITRDNACLDAAPAANSGFIVARVCREADYCIGNPCVRKCCPGDRIATAKCPDIDEDASLEKFRASLAAAAANSTAMSTFDIKNYGLLSGKTCTSSFALDPWEKWGLGSLGEIIVPDYPTYNYVNSCMEMASNDSELEDGIYPVLCFENDEHYIPDPRFEIVSGLAMTSCVFLLVTLLVYICLPSLQNLHGKTLMCHVVSLLFAYASLGIIGIITHTLFDELDNIDEFITDVVCKYLGYMLVFCFHSAFFWLNVMCFDIWWTFGGMRGQSSAARKRRQQRNRFLIYCGYAWGSALLLTGLSAVFEYAGLVDSAIGRERCWYNDNSIGEVVFFILPVTLTLLVNIVFFAITSRRCSKIKVEIKRVMANMKDPSARKFHSDKTRLIMNLKLFVVMGIPWIVENGSAYLQHYLRLPVWARELFYVADVVNSLQGLWIFILFVLKPKVYRALRKRFAAERLRDKSKSNSNNTLNVVQGGHAVRKSPSNSTLVSNFIVSSTAA